MPRVVWAEESKHGLRFEIRPSYDDAPTTSHFVTDGQSSCRETEKRPFVFVLGQGPEVPSAVVRFNKLRLILAF